MTGILFGGSRKIIYAIVTMIVLNSLINFLRIFQIKLNSIVIWLIITRIKVRNLFKTISVYVYIVFGVVQSYIRIKTDLYKSCDSYILMHLSDLAKQDFTNK